MGVGIPGFGFQLPANRLGAGLTFLESKEEQPAQQGLWEPDAAGPRDCIVFTKAPGSREGERQPRAPRGGAWSIWSWTPGFCSGPRRPLLKN